MDLRSGSGHRMNVLGTTTRSLEFGPPDNSTSLGEFQFIVVKHRFPNFRGIIGMDLLQRLEAKWDIANNKIELGGHLFDLSHVPSGTPVESYQLCVGKRLERSIPVSGQLKSV